MFNLVRNHSAQRVPVFGVFTPVFFLLVGEVLAALVSGGAYAIMGHDLYFRNFSLVAGFWGAALGCALYLVGHYPFRTMIKWYEQLIIYVLAVGYGCLNTYLLNLLLPMCRRTFTSDADVIEAEFTLLTHQFWGSTMDGPFLGEAIDTFMFGMFKKKSRWFRYLAPIVFGWAFTVPMYFFFGVNIPYIVWNFFIQINGSALIIGIWFCKIGNAMMIPMDHRKWSRTARGWVTFTGIVIVGAVLFLILFGIITAAAPDSPITERTALAKALIVAIFPGTEYVYDLSPYTPSMEPASCERKSATERQLWKWGILATLHALALAVLHVIIQWAESYIPFVKWLRQTEESHSLLKLELATQSYLVGNIAFGAYSVCHTCIGFKKKAEPKATWSDLPQSTSVVQVEMVSETPSE